MQSSLVLLPVITYILFVMVFYRGTNSSRMSIAFVKSHLVIFSFIAISTELFSLIDQITFSTFLVVWLLFLLAGCFLTYKHWNERDFTFLRPTNISLVEKILLGAIFIIVITTFFTAIVFPPNNFDSMTYHLPRVLHWINNQNVSFYPTDITRQNYQMPLAEFAILHLQLLSGGDWYANLVQWVSFIVLICLAANVAEELGLNKKLQLLSALAMATLPMAILQASSTQNDLVVSAFLMSFAYFMLRLRTTFNIENLLFAGISLGLALLTKGTAYIYGAAIGVSLALPILLANRQQLGRFLKVGAGMVSVVLIALALNTGHLWRTFQLYGDILPLEADRYRNQDMSLATLESNVLRNIALHLGTPNDQVNAYEFDLLDSLLGERLNDPKTTMSGPFHIPYNKHEDKAGNLIQMILILTGVFLLPLVWREGHHRKSIWYSLGIASGAILYCWVFKWQPWASRLHTPLFALATPLIAIVITKGIASKRIGYFISILLVLYSLPFVLANSSRSIVSMEWISKDRTELYFRNWPGLYKDYKAGIQVLGNIENGLNGDVGLYAGFNDYEYPLWVLADEKAEKERAFSFRSVGVRDVSKKLDAENFLPTYIIATKSIAGWDYGTQYDSIYDSKHLSVMQKRTLP